MKTFPLLSLVSCALALNCPAAPVIVNEINAGAGDTLPGVNGQLAPGDWFELVVVGDGTPGSTVDMRGWTLRVDNNGVTGTGRFTLSSASYWSAVQAGTILTFHEDNAASNGVDTSILGTDRFATEGWAHTNVWVGDSTYILTSAPDYDGNYPIDQSNSQIAIFDSVNTLVFGPAGEGHAGYPGGGVNASEIFKLEADPSPSITLTSPYNDGSSHTFGTPNVWNQGANKQSFAAFIVPEPSAFALLMAGLAGMAGRRRRGAGEKTS